MSETLARVLWDHINGAAAKYIVDGADSLLGVAAKLRNAAGAIVNPATEDTLATRATAAAQTDGSQKAQVVDGADTLDINASGQAAIQNPPNLDVALSTRATEATLATRATQTTAAAIQTVLEAIRDTAGVKKITDALPTGDNWIGRTKIGDGVDTAAIVTIDGVKYIAAGKPNTLDGNNSSTAQLAPAGVFNGTATDVSQFASVAITVHSDKDSALDGMRFEFSQNGTDWDDSYKFNLVAASSQTRRFQFPVTARYFRVSYTNGAVATTEFRVQTILHRENILTSIHRIEDVAKEDRSAQLVKSAIIAQREGSLIQDFFPIQADVSGNLKVTTIGTDVPSDPAALVLDFAKSGGSGDLRVDGSVTPVHFDIGPTVADEVWSIRELLLTFTADDFNFDGVSFGPNPKLTNGIAVKVVKDAVTTTVFTVIQNEDFLRLPGRTPLVNNTGPKDVLGAAISFQGLVLNQATSDAVRVTISDDLTGVKLKYLTATLFAVKVV